MIDSYALQVLIILALIPLIIAGMHCLLEPKDRTKRTSSVARRKRRLG